MDGKNTQKRLHPRRRIRQAVSRNVNCICHTGGTDHLDSVTNVGDGRPNVMAKLAAQIASTLGECDPRAHL
jgi:hypothetical protein